MCNAPDMTESESKGTRRIVVGMYSFKTRDPIKLATFWGQLMDLPLADGASSELAMLDFNHEHAPVTWLFERVDAADRSVGNRIGLDIAVGDAGADWAAAADRAEALGATRLGEHEQGGARWIEMRDPEGNLFRVFGPRPQ